MPCLSCVLSLGELISNQYCMQWHFLIVLILTQEKIEMAKSLVWKDLTQFQLDEYIGFTSRTDCHRFLNKHFHLKEVTPDEERSIILCDLYFYTLEFAKKQKLSPAQTSAYFSIVKETHRYCSEDPKINLEKDYAYFKNLMLLHSVQRPPYSEKIFPLKQMMILLEHTTNTYFRHYLMYKYAFTKKLRLEFTIENFMPIPEPNQHVVEVDEEVREEEQTSNTTRASEALATSLSSQGETKASNHLLFQGAKNLSNGELFKKVNSQQKLHLIEDDGTIEASVTADVTPAIKVSPKHEAALQDLKQFIGSVLSKKLDEIKKSSTDAEKKAASLKLKK